MKKIGLGEAQGSWDNVGPELEHEKDIKVNIEDNTAQETQIVRRSSKIRHEPERYYGFLLVENGDMMLID